MAAVQGLNEAARKLVRAMENEAMAQGLRRAVERQEFSHRFQPIVDAGSGRIIAGELLLRWHRAAGEVSPAVFVPIAERTGDIMAIGAWVFRQGCGAEVRWRHRWGLLAPYVSINVSTRQLENENLMDEFNTVLRDSGADPKRIVLEIGEPALMADAGIHLCVLRQLADLGFRIAIDDFGTGSSSLSQLTKMPIDVLKIDRAFVAGIETQPEILTIARAIIGLAREFGMKIVAKGVETAEQRSVLVANGCDCIQGHLFYKPMEEAAFVAAVDAQASMDAASAVAGQYFVIYVSQATRVIGDAELAGILKAATSFNRTNEITGFLVYRDGYFLQLLEGKEVKVRSLMEKIKRDPRHGEIRVSVEGMKKHRLFPDWGMGCDNMPDISEAIDFGIWQKRTITFPELADDPRTCYAFISALSDRNVSSALGLSRPEL